MRLSDRNHYGTSKLICVSFIFYTQININCKKYIYINHIDFFSIHSNVHAQKSLKRTCQGFESVTSLKFIIYSTIGLKVESENNSVGITDGIFEKDNEVSVLK